MESYELESDLRSELSRDERLLWSGRPRQGLVLRAQDLFMIPFSLMWGGFAFFWEYSALTSPASLFFRLWGIPFVLMGVYMIIGRFFWDSWLRAHTSYGVTDRRILIVTASLRRQVKSLTLRTLPDISLSVRGESGTITFGPTGAFNFWSSGTGWPGTGRQPVPAFDLAAEARQVYDLILRAQGSDGSSRDSGNQAELDDVTAAVDAREAPFWSRS